MNNISRSGSDDKFRPGDTLDEALQRELDEALGGMSLEEIVDTEVSTTTGQSTTPGVKTGKVIAIQGDDIFVDMGGKSQGILPALQYEDEPLPAIGDRIEVTIEGYERGEGLLNLSRKGAVMAAAWRTLQEGQVVEGRVTGHNKGGLELDLGGIRAFMPISQIEVFRVEDISGYDNQRFKCEVTEVNQEEKNVLVSRRKVLEREAAEVREKAYGELAEGQVVAGTVRSIMPYGAFVDIGGIDGLLHVSDMSYARVADPRSVVTEGQKVEVKVLKIDRETRKISLGLKQALPDPWLDVELKWPVNTLVNGRVTKLMDFGAFVELEAGVEGLVPISEMSFAKRIRHPSEVVKEGDNVQVRVLLVDVAKKRISLSIKQVGDDPWGGASVRWPVNTVVKGTVTRTTEFGAFVELSPGVEGLVHISELSDQRVRAVTDAVQSGQEIDAKVLSVDEENKRMSLSIKQVAKIPEYTGTTTQPEPEPEVKVQPKRKQPLKGGF
ncbi:MAG: S1 RNA-binding domain-containing protein [Phycisphaerae bacterium]